MKLLARKLFVPSQLALPLLALRFRRVLLLYPQLSPTSESRPLSVPLHWPFSLPSPSSAPPSVHYLGIL